MNALFNCQKLMPAQLHSMEIITGWHKAFAAQDLGDGSSEGVDSMANDPSSQQSPPNPDKCRRLSALLDKLALQINNHSPYSSPKWLMFDALCGQSAKPPEDLPLDLSVKSERAYGPPPPETDPFVCDTCGQTFAVHDRLAKHIASRHKNRTPESAKAYVCDICQRRFARSDMLTRHARLHTGVKPYSCSACSQEFSRSDHLATHQRTHTGEKPYRCPACPYAACRRDMITRHMRVHTRKPQSD